MPAISLVGVDAAGGTILGMNNTKLTIGGRPAAALGDAVASHGRSPHDGPVMVQASSKLTVGGIGICMAGNAASCGHTASGSSKMSSSA